MDGWFGWFWDLMSMFDLFKGKQGRILFLGLDNAGKTTLLGKLTTGQVIVHRPTNQPYSVNNISIADNITVSLTDMGGHADSRVLWRDYFVADLKGIVFVVDAANPSRFNEAKIELDKLLAECDEIEKMPIAILGNKIDMPNAVDDETLKQALGLKGKTTGKGKQQQNPNIRPIEVFMSSIVKNQGYGDAFRWLAQFV
jgi:GTP-binding protein SAR1